MTNDRFRAMQAEALAGALERVLQQLHNHLEANDRGATLIDVAFLAMDDAQRLLERVHALRKRLEAEQGREAA